MQSAAVKQNQVARLRQNTDRLETFAKQPINLRFVFVGVKQTVRSVLFRAQVEMISKLRMVLLRAGPACEGSISFVDVVQIDNALDTFKSFVAVVLVDMEPVLAFVAILVGLFVR